MARAESLAHLQKKQRQDCMIFPLPEEERESSLFGHVCTYIHVFVLGSSKLNLKTAPAAFE